jgi:hypothetical protein
MRLLDEIGEHLLGDFEIGNDAVFIGLMATMLPGVTARACPSRPPTASMRPFTLLVAIEGSLTTMPFPCIDAGVGRTESIARSLEKEKRERRLNENSKMLI